jgi:hypothetical protein
MRTSEYKLHEWREFPAIQHLRCWFEGGPVASTYMGMDALVMSQFPVKDMASAKDISISKWISLPQILKIGFL